MKITKQRLKQIIREELENVLLNDGVQSIGDRDVWAPDEEGYGYPSDTGPKGRIAKIIDDEDLDPETGERKDLALKAIRKAIRKGPIPNDARVRALPDKLSRAAGNLAAKATHGPRFIPDEDLPASAQPQAVKRRVAKQKAMAKNGK